MRVSHGWTLSPTLLKTGETSLERLQTHLQRLRLFKSRERLEALLQEATAKELAYADLLDLMLTEEVTAKTSQDIS